MTDPLSIAGSVVGITAAGVQASVKLYALAEKVATASQRVTSIADDVSSTCAILNQVRELIIPQPDAQGTLRSVFNSTALNDISHALQRCRSVFTEIESLSRRAFEQVGKRPSLHSKIELSTIQKAKWPFLQPQFAELREDMREAKGNLVLMIAVASLALAQRDGRQRPIHENEKLELGSTIVALQRARISKSNDRITSSKSQNRKWGLGRLFEKQRDMDLDDTVSAGQIQDISDGSIQGSMETVSPPSWLDRDLAPPQKRARILSSQDNLSVVDTSGAYPHQSETKPPQQHLSIGGVNPSRDTVTPNPSMAFNVTQPFLLTPSSATFDRELSPVKPVPEATSNQGYSYHGWTTDHLQGLVTGRGDSVRLSQLALPNQSLQNLVRTYTDEGKDPYVAMSELTAEQQNAIKGSFSLQSGGELVYVSSRNATVSSIFGTLNIEKLRWIVASKLSGPENHHSCDDIPPIVAGDSRPRRRLRVEEEIPPVELSLFTQEEEAASVTNLDGLLWHGSQHPSRSQSAVRLQYSGNPTLPSDSTTSFDLAFDTDGGMVMQPSIPPASKPEHLQTFQELPNASMILPDVCLLPQNVSPRSAYRAAQARDSLVPSSKAEYVATSTHYTVEESEDEIVNELLARWTTS
ncbi:unnamed protein product [Alternaria sp. RS040]